MKNVLIIPIYLILELFPLAGLINSRQFTWIRIYYEHFTFQKCHRQVVNRTSTDDSSTTLHWRRNRLITPFRRFKYRSELIYQSWFIRADLSELIYQSWLIWANTSETRLSYDKSLLRQQTQSKHAYKLHDLQVHQDLFKNTSVLLCWCKSDA